MTLPDLPEWVEGIVEDYLSDSGYEQRYSEEFRSLGPEKQLLVVLIDKYPTEMDPVDLAEETDCSIGKVYPHLCNLEQDEIVYRAEGGEYRLAWRRPTEDRLESYFGR